MNPKISEINDLIKDHINDLTDSVKWKTGYIEFDYGWKSAAMYNIEFLNKLLTILKESDETK
jgi:hypothetical protein